MQILILDIGCSYTKGYLFNRTLDIVADYKLSTDITSPEALETSIRDLLSKFENYAYQAIFPLSFGEGVIYNNTIYEPTHNRVPLVEDYYNLTGTPTDVKRDIGSALSIPFDLSRLYARARTACFNLYRFSTRQY